MTYQRLQNDRFIRSLWREPTDRRPVWLMRQAGRYLPEYRQLRASAPDFMQFCKTPALACEATLQPLARYPDLDAAIIFSDILPITEAMGLSLEFVPGTGPCIHDPIRSAEDIKRLQRPSVESSLDYVLAAIDRVLTQLAGRLPLIGFAGSPWTVACYMVEGGSSKLFQVIKGLLYREPEVLHALLEKLTEFTIDYLNAQIKAGVHAVMVFDSWGGVLSDQAFDLFSLHYLHKISDGLLREWEGRRIPQIFFTKGGGVWLDRLADLGADALGVDWTVDLGAARVQVGDRVALQGNLDPMALFGTPEAIYQEVSRILQSYGRAPGHVMNLGHGIHKDTSPAAVETMLRAVVDYQLSVTSTA